MSTKWEEGLLKPEQVRAGYFLMEDDHCLYLFKNGRLVCAFSNCSSKEDVQLAVAEDMENTSQ